MNTNLILKLAVVPFIILGMGITYGQSNQNNPEAEKTIRVKMVKNINGVETVFDTTIVGGEWTDANMPNMDIDIQIDSLLGNGDGQMIMKTIDVKCNGGGSDTDMVIMMLDENDPEFQKLMKEHGIEIVDGAKKERKMIIITDEEGIPDNDNKKKDHKMEFKIVIKTCNIVELNKADKKVLKSEGRTSFNENLKIDKVYFYPNPNNGRFNLSFNLSNNGDTEISIFNIEGKRVYNEILEDFTGDYKNEIDISKNANGIYYIRVTQGKDSWFKKMIME